MFHVLSVCHVQHFIDRYVDQIVYYTMQTLALMAIRKSIMCRAVKQYFFKSQGPQDGECDNSHTSLPETDIYNQYYTFRYTTFEYLYIPL